MRRPRFTPVVVMVCVGLAACAAGDSRFTAAEPAGFWFGLWHGFIALIALVVGIFADGVHMYERFNTGGWYDLGFLLGATCFAGGGRRSHRAWRERRAAAAATTPHLPARVRVDIDWGERGGGAGAGAPPAAGPAGAVDGPDDPSG